MVAASPVGACGAVLDEPVSSSATSAPKYDGTESYGLGKLSFEM